MTHTVTEGETLSDIAQNYDVTEEHLIALNKLGSADDITVGQTLLINDDSTLSSDAQASSASTQSDSEVGSGKPFRYYS